MIKHAVIHTPSRTVFSLTAMMALVMASGVHAQSSFSIPNPLVKPAKAVAAEGNDAKGAPVARSIENSPGSKAGENPLTMPLPSPKVGGGGAAGSVDTSIEPLTYYTVTAILGDTAILRTNVGLPSSTAAVATGTATGGSSSANAVSGSPASAGSSSQVKPRQTVLRIKSGQKITIAGIQYATQVVPYGVEFRLDSKGPVLYTAVIESQTPNSYALHPSAREALDPAVPTRLTPAVSKPDVPTTSTTSNGQGAGAGSAQR